MTSFKNNNSSSWVVIVAHVGHWIVRPQVRESLGHTYFNIMIVYIYFSHLANIYLIYYGDRMFLLVHLFRNKVDE